MNELLKINEEGLLPTISGRLLHEFLEIETPYVKWFDRMVEYGFEEVKDFWTNLSESTGGRPATDHSLTIPMAKELCMIQRSDKGKEARQYFLKVEEAWNSPVLVMGRALKIAEEAAGKFKETIAELQVQREQDKPKVLFADAVATSHGTILIGDLAKLLSQNGINTGQKRLFEFMRQNGYIIKRKGSDHNMPSQRSMELGILEIKESVHANPDGSIRVIRTPKVTGKGQQYFINLFLKERS